MAVFFIWGIRSREVFAGGVFVWRGFCSGILLGGTSARRDFLKSVLFKRFDPKQPTWKGEMTRLEASKRIYFLKKT